MWRKEDGRSSCLLSVEDFLLKQEVTQSASRELQLQYSRKEEEEVEREVEQIFD